MSHRRRVSVRERPEWQCQYRGGECTNARATKMDGTLHHLCQDHRLRANWNQRQLQIRRRQRQRQRQEETARAPRRRSATSSSRSDRVRRLNYSEWLQIVNSLEWQAPLLPEPSVSPPTSVAEWDDALFAPLATQLLVDAAPPDDPNDAWMHEQLFFTVFDTDTSSPFPSLSGDDPTVDSCDSC